MIREFLAAVAAVSVAAPALAKESPPSDAGAPAGVSHSSSSSHIGAVLDLSVATKGCRAAEAGEVVVCGERGRSPYRVDPTVLQAIRDKEKAENPPRPSDRSATAETCAVGANTCPGAGAIDFVGPLMLIAKSLVNAAEGEDWREPFRTRPDDYQLHEQAKAQRQGE